MCTQSTVCVLCLTYESWPPTRVHVYEGSSGVVCEWRESSGGAEVLTRITQTVQCEQYRVVGVSGGVVLSRQTNPEAPRALRSTHTPLTQWEERRRGGEREGGASQVSESSRSGNSRCLNDEVV